MKKVLLEGIYWLNDERSPLALPFILAESEKELISLYNGERITIVNEYNNFMIDCKNSLINHYKRDVNFSEYVNFSDCNTFFQKHQYLMPTALKFATWGDDKVSIDKISKYTSTHYATDEYIKNARQKYRSQNYKYAYSLEK